MDKIKGEQSSPDRVTPEFTRKNSDPITKSELEALKKQRSRPQNDKQLKPKGFIEKSVNKEVSDKTENRIKHIETRIKKESERIAIKREFSRARKR